MKNARVCGRIFYMWGEGMNAQELELLIAHHYVPIDKSFVFFNTLAEEKLSFYKSYYKTGMSYVAAANNMLKGQNDISNANNLTNIQAYIKMIGDAANNAKQIELNFFSQIKDMTQGNEELKEKIDNFLSHKDDFNFNYLEFITLLNKIMLENNKLNAEIQEKVLNNMELYQEAYNNAPQALQNIIMESYQNFTKNKGKLIYTKELQNLIKEAYPNEDDPKITSQAFSLIASLINKAVFALDANPALKSMVEQQFIRAGINQNDVRDLILSGITQEALSLTTIENITKISGKQVIDSVIQKLNYNELNLSRDYADQVVESFQKKTKNIRTIEDLALTSGRGVARAFQSLTPQSQQELIKEYGIDPKIISATTKHELAIGTQNINMQIRKYFEQYYQELMKKLTAALQSTGKRAALSEVRKEIQQKSIPQNVINSSLSVKISQSSLSEFLIAYGKEYLNQVFLNPNITKTYKIGQLQLKTDVILNFLSKNLIPDIQGQTREKIFDILDSSSKNFLQNYHDKSNGEINVDIAEKEFRAEQRRTESELRNFLKQTGLAHNKINTIITELSDFISQSISVKDYNVYLNEGGFHAQSLGANSEKTINNIIRMYELGGISGIDKELLLFAVHNCATATIGGESLKTSLADFLLGGAALMTFDEGFSLLPEYIKTFENDFHTTKMLLYNLEGRFIPASYVLFTVYSNLLKVYGIIEEQTYSIKNDTNKVIINNNIDNSDIPPYWEVPYAKDRWNIVKSIASNEITIKMEFMAGLLDIYKAISAAFTM